MNYPLRLLLITVAILAIVYAPNAIRPRLQAWLAEQQSRRSIDDAIRSTAYRLPDERWLDIPIPPHTLALRILTNAAVRQPHVPPASLHQPRDGWRYAVEYALNSGEGIPHEQHTYHLRTRLTEIEDPDTGQPIGITWFANLDQIPAQTRTIQIPLNKFSATTSLLRLRLAKHDAQVEEVVVRVYAKQQRQGYEQPYTWSRLSHERRERLCRSLVYPPDLLSPREKLNLLRWIWTALPPAGRAGAQYEARRLYQQTSAFAIQDIETPPENGFFLKPDRPVTVMIPEGPGQVEVECEPIDDVGPSLNDELLIRQFRALHGMIHEQARKGRELLAPYTRHTDGGILELRANRTLGCRVTWRPVADDSAENAFPSEPVNLPTTVASLRSYLLDDKKPLIYRLTHLPDQPTPFRISVRRYRALPDDGLSTTRANTTRANTTNADEPNASESWASRSFEPTDVTYLCRDQSGEVIAEGVIVTASDAAIYDEGTLGPLTVELSEPRTVYLQLRSDVATIELRCKSGDAAISAFTRPLDLPRTFPAPGANVFLAEQADSARTWFLLQPEQYRQRIRDNGCVNLQLQTRPPDANAAILEGRYYWQDYEPLEYSLGRFVLTARDPELSVRPEAIPSLFLQVVPGVEYRVRPVADMPDHRPLRLEPSLIYQHDRNDPPTLTVWLDGRRIGQFTPRAARGEIRLPTVTSSNLPRTFRVDAPDDVRLFINHLSMDGQPQFIKRFMHQLDKQPQTFVVTKHRADAETLILRVIRSQNGQTSSEMPAAPVVPDPPDAPDPQSDPYRLSVHVDDSIRPLNMPLDGWTLRLRHLEIRSTTDDQDDQAFFVDSPQARVNGQDRRVIVLDADLPPGQYRITVAPDRSMRHPAFISLYRVDETPVAYRSWSVSHLHPEESRKVTP